MFIRPGFPLTRADSVVVSAFGLLARLRTEELLPPHAGWGIDQMVTGRKCWYLLPGICSKCAAFRSHC
ncbi:hypothetical protein ACFWC2_31085, partial [Streptomyces diastaticus]|uniref:hypothetical protein n=1 Tax=Streptomyces diastaticus TaxID=1956 RepID=UPI003669C890